MRDLYAARVRASGGIFSALAPRPAFLAPERLLDIILPPQIARDFDHLTTPLKIVASDFYAQEAVVFSSGPLRRAIAASMALPVIFQPVQIDGRVLIDGGLVNPLPFDLVAGEADLTVAVDASGAPVRRVRARRCRRRGRRCLPRTSSSSAPSSARSCATAIPTSISTPAPAAFRSSTS